jgi:hypothetical protein
VATCGQALQKELGTPKRLTAEQLAQSMTIAFESPECVRLFDIRSAAPNLIRAIVPQGSSGTQFADAAIGAWLATRPGLAKKIAYTAPVEVPGQMKFFQDFRPLAAQYAPELKHEAAWKNVRELFDALKVAHPKVKKEQRTEFDLVFSQVAKILVAETWKALQSMIPPAERARSGPPILLLMEGLHKLTPRRNFRENVAVITMSMNLCGKVAQPEFKRILEVARIFRSRIGPASNGKGQKKSADDDRDSIA